MRKSLIVSALLHLLVLAVVLINVSSGRKSAPAPARVPVSVDLVPSSDVSQAKAGSQDQAEAGAPPKAMPEEKKAEARPTAPEPKPVEKPAKKQAVPPPSKPKTATAEPPVKHDAAQEKADAELEPDERPKPKPKPKQTVVLSTTKRVEPTIEKLAEAPPPERQVTPDPKPKPEPEREAKRPPPQRDRIGGMLQQPPAPPEPDNRAESKTKFDPHRIAALLNRDPTAGQQPADQGPKQPWRPASSLQEQATGMTPGARDRTAYGVPNGRDARMSANEIDAFIGQISRCWTPPVGGLGGDAIVVKLHIELNEDGTLARPPQVANSVSSPFFTPAADSAVRAVLQCQPYRMPPEKFGQWRDMMLNFDPREMYGG